MTERVLRSVAIWLRGEVILVQPLSHRGEDSGIWYWHGPFIKLAADASDKDLGAALLDSLSLSISVDRWPVREELAAFERAQWKAMGVRSWRQFAAGTIHVTADDLGHELNLVPSTFVGPPVGWRELTEQIVRVANADSTVVGIAIREALARSSGGEVADS